MVKKASPPVHDCLAVRGKSFALMRRDLSLAVVLAGFAGLALPTARAAAQEPLRLSLAEALAQAAAAQVTTDAGVVGTWTNWEQSGMRSIHV